MNYAADMRRCREYIDLHIHDEITPKALADLLGYSFYHFCHVFRICNGVPVGVYLRRRRLETAACALNFGEKVTEIALA
ncbi:MAG: AraC family transcriptional regulator [Clostridia bacterium]|nr:AraC family transcriptional regulator [Clostridia bacterium]MDR3645226.1 AraC family transcriptional regulator [Clostridia bacterium]